MPAPPRRLIWFLALALAPPLAGLAVVGDGSALGLWGPGPGSDPSEPNDRPEQAARPELVADGDARTWSGRLMARGDDLDYFRLVLQPGQGLKAEATALGTRLSVHDAEGVLLHRGLREPDRQASRLAYAPPAGAGQTELLVRTWGAQGPYELSLAAVPVQQRFEPNDDPLDAFPLRPGRQRAILCSGRDYFRLRIPARRRLQVGLSNLSAPALALELLDDAELERQAVGPGSGTEIAVNVAPAAAEREVVLKITGSQVRYDLEVALPLDDRQGPAPSLPERTLPEGADDSPTLAKPLEHGIYRDVAFTGQQDHYRLTIPPRSTARVDLSFRHDEGDLDMGLQELSATGIELPWSSGIEDHESLSLYCERETRLLVILSRVDPTPSEQRYTLAVNVRSGKPPLRLVPGRYRIRDSDVTAWSLRLQPGQTLSVRATDVAEDRPYRQPPRLSLQGRDLLTATIDHRSGTAELAYTAYAEEELALRVSGQGGRLDCELKVEVIEEEADQSPTGRQTGPPSPLGPGVYAGLELEPPRQYVLTPRVGQRIEVALEGNEQRRARRRARDRRQILPRLTLRDEASGEPLAQAEDPNPSLDWTADRERVVLEVGNPALDPADNEAFSDLTLRLRYDGQTRGQAPRLELRDDPHALWIPGRATFSVAVPPGRTLRARADAGELVDVDLFLRDPNGLELARAETRELLERAQATAPSEGLIVQLELVIAGGGSAPVRLGLELLPGD